MNHIPYQWTSSIEAKMGENLCLKWTSFQENVKHAFGNMRKDMDFTDVALACEDGEQVEAHRVILAASSPFFQNILKNKKQSPHLLIYMRGVKSEDLMAIIDFLYMGEATVRKENLEDFLAVAAELKIAGLMKQAIGKDFGNLKDVERDLKGLEKDLKDFENEVDNLKEAHKVLDPEETKSEDDSELREVETEKIPMQQSHFSGNLEELDETVKSMMVKSTNFAVNRKTFADICKVCGKEGLGSNIKNHIEINHLDNIQKSFEGHLNN